jgi:hypothetical protein
MGALFSIVIDDDFSLFLFRVALTQGGWSVADFARLGCTSTLARTWARMQIARANREEVRLLLLQMGNTDACVFTERIATHRGLDASLKYPGPDAPLLWYHVTELEVDEGHKSFIVQARQWFSSYLATTIFVSHLFFADPSEAPASSLCRSRGAALFRMFDDAIRWALRERQPPPILVEEERQWKKQRLL